MLSLLIYPLHQSFYAASILSYFYFYNSKILALPMPIPSVFPNTIKFKLFILNTIRNKFTSLLKTKRISSYILHKLFNINFDHTYRYRLPIYIWKNFYWIYRGNLRDKVSNSFVTSKYILKEDSFATKRRHKPAFTSRTQ